MKITKPQPPPLKIQGGDRARGPQAGPSEPVLRIRRSTAADQSDWKRTEATRYLCVAAHLDPHFRNRVIQQLMEEEHKAIAVSYGIDPCAVLNHCLVARRRQRIRDLLLALPFLLGFIVLMLFGNRGAQFGPDLVLIALLVVFPVAWIIVGWDKWHAEFAVVRENLSDANFNPDCERYPSNSKLRRIFEQLDAAQHSNVIIHGGFSPFVGSGRTIGAWSIALDINKGKEELGKPAVPQPFQVRELYAELCSALQTLGLRGLIIEDKLCVNGQDIRGDARFLPDLLERPRTKIDPAIVQTFVDNPSQEVRHYKHIRLVDWSGELVFSTFLRFSKPGHSLFIEANYCLITPLADSYHAVDSWNPVPSWEDWVRLLTQSAFKAVFMTLATPFLLLAHALGPVSRWQHRREMRKAVMRNPAFDHGAESSMREEAGAWRYRRYFQQLDREMYLKILERQIFDTIVRFLDSKDIDTSDLKQRQDTILNSGVILSGSGTIQAESLAVGSRASAVSEHLEPSGRVRLLSRLTRRASAGEQ